LVLTGKRVCKQGVNLSVKRGKFFGVNAGWKFTGKIVRKPHKMLLELAQKNGLSPVKMTATEYASSCPVCGGNDRFRLWPESGRYWCRQCGAKGDAIQFLRDFSGLSYKEAVRVAGKSHLITNIATKAPTMAQSTQWRRTVSKLAQQCHDALLRDAEKLAWLRSERGLTVETVKMFSLGWNHKNRWLDRRFLPSGLTIPWRDIRLRIRRDEPGDRGRYHVFKGSSTEPLEIGTPHNRAAIILESELDALLVHQIATRLFYIVALGSAQKLPSRSLLDRVKQAEVLLVALDSDKAGQKASSRWLNHVPGCFRLPPIRGKDVTDMYKNGVDLNQWLADGFTICRNEQCSAIHK
jgi:DNA primase